MRKLLASLILVLGLCLPCHGGNFKGTVVIRGGTFPNHIVILIDTSASMGCNNNENYHQAMVEAMDVARGLTDDETFIKFYTFDTTWCPEPQGWIKLPDKEALDKVEAYLRMLDTSGTTDLVHAMEHVLSEPVPDLGVIIITDEMINAGNQAIDRILEMNTARAKIKGAPAVLGVISLPPLSTNLKRPALGRRVAESSGGTYIKLRRIKE